MGTANDADQNPGATGTLAKAATPAVPERALPSTSAVASTSDGPAVPAAPTEALAGDDVLSTLVPHQDGSGPSKDVAVPLPDAPGAGSPSDDVTRNAPPGDVTGEGSGAARGVTQRGSSFESALRAGPVHVLANGTTPAAAASALSTATTDTSGTPAVSAEEDLEPAEFPDTGGGTTDVDISDLAASISRPLAGGSGDYSVQVSLHPPELGEVRALLSLQGDVLHVTLTPEHSSGFDALSDALPSLHEQLAGGGVEVHVTLGQSGDPGGRDGRAAAEAGWSGSARPDDATPDISLAAVPVSTAGSGRIHLVL